MSGYLTVQEVAALARCEHKSVRRAIKSGRLVAFEGAKRWLIRETDARAWIEAKPIRPETVLPAPSRDRLPARPRWIRAVAILMYAWCTPVPPSTERNASHEQSQPDQSGQVRVVLDRHDDRRAWRSLPSGQGYRIPPERGGQAC